MEQENHPNVTNVALIVGVTGMAGLSLAKALKSPNALGSPWQVYGVARRPEPSWFPSSIVDKYITFDATNTDDTHDKLAHIANKVTHVFWVAIQVRENEEANVKVNAAMLTNVFNVLKSGTQHYMGPIHDLAHSVHLIPHGPPFIEDLPRLSYPNFYYALEDVVASHAPSLTYSVHCSSIIIGASSRSMYNALLTMAVYATICRHESMAFRFPGTHYTWEHFCDISDTRVLAKQHIWAVVTEKAKKQAFNCTNGDVFTWKSFWKVSCEIFNVEFVPFDEAEEFDFVGMMEAKGKVWDEIVEKYGLYKTQLNEICCFVAIKNVLHFGFQHVCSMNESREFGPFGYAD
ncbi:hypothetical protein ACB092_02G068100 [Castanea dentata]